MADDKPESRSLLEAPPIPTYDEATSSRPSSSQSFLGPSEVSNDAERQGLLAHHSPGNGRHQQPTVESARSSFDFLPTSLASSSRNSDESLRHEMEQMDVEEPHSHGGTRFSKHITTITHSLSSSLSSINLPFREYLPSLDYIRAHLPNLSLLPKPAWIKLPGWIMFLRFLALLLVLSLAYILFLSDVFTFKRRGGMAHMYDPESVRQFVQNHVNASYISQNLAYLTEFDHIAGTQGNFFLAEWVKDVMQEAALENVGLERFDVYLNYPTKDGRRVAIVDPPERAWQAKLEEEQAYTDPPREQTYVFHGHSRAGNVTGPLIYANYGSREDFKTLLDSGISLNGSIALVRYYGSQGDRALKVKAAELAGCAGCIIYSDPAEDGFVRGAAFPDGRFRPADGVQRGAVSLMSWVVGDVLSPGFASTPGEKKRVSKDNNPGLNNIPSLPLAWRDAQVLLQSLKGAGERLNDESWLGGVPDVEWWTGSLSSSPTINVANLQDEVTRQPIYNVLGRITGIEQPEKKIVVGNHRDAWCFGAADPGSGTAVFLEVVRIFGELKKMGWRPLRSIEFASWDAEEYNLVGSTEHVEARIEDLRRDGIAYINVDVAVLGDDFRAAASPVMEKPLLRVLNRVADPARNKTLRQIWEEKGARLEGLGAGSDYVAFQDLAGTSSLDMSFRGAPYPYHSCYDNYAWMSRYGDPGFTYHGLMAQVWSLLILELADELVLPFDLVVYSKSVMDYVRQLEKDIEDKGGAPYKEGSSESVLGLGPLYKAAQRFEEAALRFHDWDREWEGLFGAGVESDGMERQRLERNERMARFETDLLDLGGGVSFLRRRYLQQVFVDLVANTSYQLPGREQFKHVLFAPQAWSGYDEAFFPGIRDAVDERDWKLAQKQVEKVARIIERACRRLLHGS